MIRPVSVFVFLGSSWMICSPNFPCTAASQGSIRFHGSDAELTICELSDRMVQIVVSPIDGATDQAQSAPS